MRETSINDSDDPRKLSARFVRGILAIAARWSR